MFDCIYFKDDCPFEPIVINSFQFARLELNITLVQNETNIRELAKVSCPCGGKVSSGTGQSTQYHGGDFTDGAKWSNTAIESCNITDFAQEICHLTKVFLI